MSEFISYKQIAESLGYTPHKALRDLIARMLDGGRLPKRCCESFYEKS
jgi:hypothetical protein